MNRPAVDAEHVSDFLNGEALVISQRDHLPQGNGQGENGAGDGVIRLGKDCGWLRQLVHIHPAVNAAEPSTTEHIPAGVHRDAHQPCLFRRLSMIFIMGAPGLQEGFLHRVLSQRGVPQQQAACAQQRYLPLRHGFLQPLIAYSLHPYPSLHPYRRFNRAKCAILQEKNCPAFADRAENITLWLRQAACTPSATWSQSRPILRWHWRSAQRGTRLPL